MLHLSFGGFLFVLNITALPKTVFIWIGRGMWVRDSSLANWHRMGTLFCHSESNPHRILTIFCSHFLKEKKHVNNTPLSLHFHISEKDYSQGNSEFHKFIHSANLLNNYYVPVSTQVLTNSRYTKGKKPIWLFTALNLRMWNVTTIKSQRLEIASCPLDICFLERKTSLAASVSQDGKCSSA